MPLKTNMKWSHILQLDLSGALWNLPKGSLETALDLRIDLSRIGINIGIDTIMNKLFSTLVKNTFSEDWFKVFFPGLEGGGYPRTPSHLVGILYPSNPRKEGASISDA